MIAKGKKDIREKFGFRILNDEEKPQSYCKKCRVEHTNQINSVKRMLRKEGYYGNPKNTTIKCK